MGIRTIEDYVKFYLDLNVTDSIPLERFVNNEKSVIKHKIETKQLNHDALAQGLKILDELLSEIKSMGQDKVLEKYSKNFKK